MQIRRTDGEMLKKIPKDGSGVGDKDAVDADADNQLVVSREKCIPVVRGLMALILSMDFTCNVDLFLIACKVRDTINSWVSSKIHTIFIPSSATLQCKPPPPLFEK